jgi:hypothetical protein
MPPFSSSWRLFRDIARKASEYRFNVLILVGFDLPDPKKYDYLYPSTLSERLMDAPPVFCWKGPEDAKLRL